VAAKQPRVPLDTVVEVAIEEDLVHIRRQVHLRMLDQACPEPLCTASGTVDDREVRQTQVVSDVQVEPLLCQWFLPDHVLISSRFPCPLARHIAISVVMGKSVRPPQLVGSCGIATRPAAISRIRALEAGAMLPDTHT
jgi:hypothetical protein